MYNTAMKNPVNIKKITPFVSLSGRFLVAMPNIDDIRFERAVIYVYEHTPSGAAGLVINRPAAQMSFSELLEQLQIDHLILKNQPTLLVGGPDNFPTDLCCIHRNIKLNRHESSRRNLL